MTDKKLPPGVKKVVPPKPKPKPKTGRAAYDPNSATSKRIARSTGENLSPKSKLIRQRFVREYIYDFQGRAAGLRAGFKKASVSKKVSELLREPYVQQLLKQYIEEEKEESLVTRNIVLAGLKKEANYFGHMTSHSARVAAFSKLAKILGMEVPAQAMVGEVHLHFDKQDSGA